MKPLPQVRSQVSLRTPTAGNSAGSSGGSSGATSTTRTSIGKSGATKGMRRASSVRLGQAPSEPAPKKAFKP
jgi:hypothetical protein